MTNQEEINHKNLFDKYFPNANNTNSVPEVDFNNESFSVVYQNLRLLFKPEVKAVEAITKPF